MFTLKFWKDLGERSIRTFAQGAASYLTLAGLDVIQADLKTAALGGLAAGGYAVITALAAYLKDPALESASLSKEVATAPDQVLADPPGFHAQDNPRWK